MTELPDHFKLVTVRGTTRCASCHKNISAKVAAKSPGRSYFHPECAKELPR